MEPLKRLAREMHRRSIWQVLSVYAVGGWIAFSVVQTLTEGLGLPDWFPPFAMVLLIIGLPIVLATAIVQEGLAPPEPPLPGTTHSGDGLDATAAIWDKLFTWKNAIGGGVLAFALWGVIAAAWILFGSGTSSASGARTNPDRTTIAVLPFTSVRTDEDSESFRVGLHDELLTQLFKVGDLRVTSRTSVLEYEGTVKKLGEIGRELGVAVLVEGGVQREGQTVQINVQLIDVATDEHLWAESYTRNLAEANIIRMQGEVVRDIARTLRAVLSPAEETSLDAVPTENPEAYVFYLRGRAREVLRDAEGLLDAEEMLLRAVELDPTFALAYARLGTVHNSINWYGVDRSDERLAKSLASIEKAFALRPDLPEAHVALARYYYQGRLDYEGALRELDLAEAGGAVDAELFTVRGAIERRRGRLDQAIVAWTRALETDPRNPGLLWDFANTLTALRRYEEAERYYDRALDIAPGDWTQYRRKAWNSLAWKGDLDEARRILEAGERSTDSPDVSEQTWSWYEFELLARNPAAALAQALRVGPAWIPIQFRVVYGSGMVGEAYFRMGENGLAEEHFNVARTVLEDRLTESPGDPFVHQALSWIHVRLGGDDEAIRLAERATELLPVSTDAWRGTDLLRDLAAVYAVSNRPQQAIDLLEQLLAMPSRAVSREILRIDPVWDPLREEPGFAALVSER
ncbi:MAG: tetratricopeptide repeat protein [Gemmatimonadota bacterium]|nr:tetratricopeptide repeat protein [Gemmatimonadota bacterium]